MSTIPNYASFSLMLHVPMCGEGCLTASWHCISPIPAAVQPSLLALLLLTVRCLTVYSCPACSAQQLALKERGNPMWFHPSRLTSGGQFATTSAAFRARQAAQALLATAQHLYMGSRQAETARGTWDHSSVPGLSAEPPVWALGLSGLLKQFQATLGTGFAAVYYHCKGYMDFGTPEYHDILPAALQRPVPGQHHCPGLCCAHVPAASITSRAHYQTAAGGRAVPPAAAVQVQPAAVAV